MGGGGGWGGGGGGSGGGGGDFMAELREIDRTQCPMLCECVIRLETGAVLGDWQGRRACLEALVRMATLAGEADCCEAEPLRVIVYEFIHHLARDVLATGGQAGGMAGGSMKGGICGEFVCVWGGGGCGERVCVCGGGG